ncbi:hypothetical protein [Allohahella sp. A8]|uniref:hypothetical protein n=1 Tax=Allohahella sp. A8 TaxID=3141461 RepID=UPI003A7FB35A
MNQLLDWWVALNTIVIMFALGAARHEENLHEPWLSWPLVRAVLGYNTLIPAGALAMAFSFGWFSSPVITGMALCIAAAGGSSAGAFVAAAGGSGRAASVLIVCLVGVSVAAINLFSWAGVIDLGDVSFLSLSAYSLAITMVPLIAGMFARYLVPEHTDRAQPYIERLGSWLVGLLILVLAGNYGYDILTGPVEPLIAAVLLGLVFAAPPMSERAKVWMRSVVLVTLIRNLSLALSLLAILPEPEQVLPTVLAFGLCMYVMAAGLLWYWRRLDMTLIAERVQA